MTDQYTVRMGEQDYGPVDLALLKTWRAEGRLLPESLVWKHGSPGWVPFSAIPEAADDATALVSPVAAAGRVPLGQAKPGSPSSAAEPTVTLLEVSPKAGRQTPSPVQAIPTPHGSPASPASLRPDTPTPRATSSPMGSAGVVVPPPHGTSGVVSSPDTAGPDAASRPAPTRPKPIPAVRRPPEPAASLPIGWMLIGGILLVLVVAGVMAYSLFLRPMLDRHRMIAEIRQKALPDRKLTDPKAGLELALPNGWYLLPADSTLVLDPGSRTRLAYPARAAFASLRMEEQPRLDITLDAYALRQVEGRRLLRPDLEQTNSEDGRIAGQPCRTLAVRWSEDGVETAAVITVWRDAWRWYTLTVWSAGGGSESPAAMAQAIGGGISLVDRLAERVAAAATSLENDAPELGRDSARLLAMDALASGQQAERLSVAAIREVSRGLYALSADEVREMTALYAQIYAPVPDNERARLASWLAAVRDGRSVPTEETLAMRALLNQGILSLPEESRARLVELNTKAVAAALRPS